MKISIVSSTEHQTYNNNITQKYTKQSSEYYNELTNSGMKKYTKLELDSMVSTFQARVQLALKNDITNSISITNSGMKKYSKEEFNRIQSTFTALVEPEQSKSLENERKFREV